MIKGIGVDLVDITRVDLKIARNVLRKEELEIFNTNKNKQKFLASRFAIKEAIIKASNKEYSFLDINIIKEEKGRLITNIKGINVSISYENDIVIAFVVWEEL